MRYLIKVCFDCVGTRFDHSRIKFFEFCQKYSVDLSTYKQDIYGYTKFKINGSERELSNFVIDLQSVQFNIKSIKKVRR